MVVLILGIGIDIIEIGRIEAAIQNERFNEKVFTENERLESKLQAHRLAGFFAAKEALLKAMGTGLAGFCWQEIEVAHNAQGAPYFKTSGKVAEFLQVQRVSKVHLSISHCREYATAQVILEV
ncbi:MAG TPA: holo-ACP synthase [Bacillota bacterium]|nr:holo-ACP synthase [Bacillota bacterium]